MTGSLTPLRKIFDKENPFLDYFTELEKLLIRGINLDLNSFARKDTISFSFIDPTRFSLTLLDFFNQYLVWIVLEGDRFELSFFDTEHRPQTLLVKNSPDQSCFYFVLPLNLDKKAPITIRLTNPHHPGRLEIRDFLKSASFVNHSLLQKISEIIKDKVDTAIFNAQPVRTQEMVKLIKSLMGTYYPELSIEDYLMNPPPPLLPEFSNPVKTLVCYQVASDPHYLLADREQVEKYYEQLVKLWEKQIKWIKNGSSVGMFLHIKIDLAKYRIFLYHKYIYPMRKRIKSLFTRKYF